MSDTELRLPSCWMPTAELVCFKCHGPVFPRATMDDAQFAEHTAPQPRRPGEFPGNCTRCAADIWAEDRVGPLATIRAALGGELQQTGGMCSALQLEHKDGGIIFVTALDGPIMVGYYEDEQAIYEADCDAMWDTGDDEPTDDDVARVIEKLREEVA